MTRAPRAGASSSGSGATVKAPWPSDDQRQASSVPARRASTTTSVGDHERRIEADAELADQIGRLLVGVFGGEPVEKGARAGAGDGAERVDQFGARHADAVVDEGDRLGVGVERDLDAERSARLDQLRLGDRLVAQLLAGVGGVGDEFADEDVAVRIDRMDHQLQKARDIRLEILGFRLLAGGEHARPSFNFASSTMRNGRGGRRPRRRRSYREDFLSFQGACDIAGTRGKKKADRPGGGPPIRQPAWQIQGPDAARGLGGKIHRARRRTEPSRLVIRMTGRCGVGIDHKQAKRRHLSRPREQRRGPPIEPSAWTDGSASSPWRRLSHDAPAWRRPCAEWAASGFSFTGLSAPLSAAGAPWPSAPSASAGLLSA